LRYTSVWNSAMLQTADVENAMAASIRRAKPRFEKL
jgi:delta(3,5)-delta(2,4)-dienoyl-CoA isomerase